MDRHRSDRYRLDIIVSFRIHHWTSFIPFAQFTFTNGKPELSCHSADGKEESILQGLRQDLARPPIDPQLEQHELLDAVEILPSENAT